MFSDTAVFLDEFIITDFDQAEYRLGALKFGITTYNVTLNNFRNNFRNHKKQATEPKENSWFSSHVGNNFSLIYRNLCGLLIQISHFIKLNNNTHLAMKCIICFLNAGKQTFVEFIADSL